MDGLEFALRYPFSPQAKKIIEDMSLSERIVELGLERAKKALKGNSSARVVFSDNDKKEEIASFAAARMILGHLRNPYLTNRFAVNESKTMRNRLEKEDERRVDEIASYFGIEARKDKSRIILDIPTYISFSPGSPHYKLINRRIVNGMVEINATEKRRLIEEAVKKHIEKIPIVKNPPDEIKKAGERLLEELPKSQTKINVKSGDHPPCIMKLLESAKKHQNLPHHARWFLATYLLTINMSEETINAIFANMPDYSEKITRYQIAHVKKRGYSVPSCATVTSYGLCCAVCKVGTPIRWHDLPEGRKKEIRR